ncbi:peptidoglycan DD-metalloendopeptidase family protein [Streptomyces sp. NBC_01498]|uniref:peptidoglycan DD-metalloendopeptidase family protein n=1 Tax=Streptomyces sp. NBC_01498 TaxID=2975870 RepID=UPI002E7C27D6|nr:peptidoglycan DD-metalloendopeptidase family protein [Streptomyces sp. NBC_01498]WTL25751.1 peptidoglycan DD-metalloendopeptidase family protein [Streptomyces sp. NBC_01498]
MNEQQHPTPHALSRRALIRGSAGALGAGAVGLGLVGLGLAGAAGTPAYAGTRAPRDAFHNPFSGYTMTGTWQDHLNSGSLGGLDYGMGVGTPLPAAGGGVVTNIPNNGTGGHTVTIAHSNGYRTQYMHLSAFVLGNGASIASGGTVGLSGGAVGAPGSGSSTGPHVHWHMIDPNGKRINPLTFLGSGGGGSAGLPKTATEQDGVPGAVFWQRAQKWLSIEAGYAGPVDGAPGPNTYAALQRDLRDHHGYTGPVDGVPGPNTWAALQRLAGGYGYTGPVDGVMGPNSWRAVARFLNEDRWD